MQAQDEPSHMYHMIDSDPPIDKEDGVKMEDEEAEAKSKARVSTKCVKCKSRFARKGCSQGSCLHCCTSTECESHAESRAKQKYHADLLQGSTEIARQAKQVRALALVPGAFREGGFVSMKQTIKIWDLREFMANPKWKEDAIRKSQKRKARESEPNSTFEAPPRLTNSPKRFRIFLDNWYTQSLESKKPHMPSTFDR